MARPRPIRLQLSRRKGFNLQALSKAINGLEAVRVSRPGPWGNPAVVGAGFTREAAAAWFRETCADWPDGTAIFLDAERFEYRQWLRGRAPELRGKNLACWCKPGAPCHADVLLELANR